MKKLIALFDMDDTLCDTTGQTERDLRRVFSEEKEIIADYTSKRCPPYVRKEIRRIRSQPGWWENLPKMDDGFQIYNLAKSEGLETEILTKGPETYPLAWTEKLLWCQKNVPDSNLTITLDKSRYIGDLLIDDWPSYVTAWLKTNINGNAILPLRNHNQKYSHPRAIHYTGQSIEQVTALIRMLKLNKIQP